MKPIFCLLALAFALTSFSAQAACPEGTIKWFWEQKPKLNENFGQGVWKEHICLDGVYQPTTVAIGKQPVVKHGCEEGLIRWFWDQKPKLNENFGQGKWVRHICVEGIFVKQ